MEVPERMDPVANWTADETFMELWADRGRGDGLILAVTRAGSERAGTVARVRSDPEISWTGSFADRPVPWQNAQAAIVRARLAERS